MTDAFFTIVKDGHNKTVGRGVINDLGLAIIQQQLPINGKSIDNIKISSQCSMKEAIAS